MEKSWARSSFSHMTEISLSVPARDSLSKELSVRKPVDKFILDATAKRKLCIDLCSGFGLFSEPFLKAGWKVIRIDNDEKFLRVPFTHICDVRDMVKLKLIVNVKEPTVIVASPPCERFSLANRMFPKKGIRQALDMVGAVYEVIAEFRPKYWIVENPKGRLRWFLGKPNSTVSLSDYGGKYKKPTDLWHNFPLPLVKAEMPFEPSWSSIRNQGKGSTGLLRLRDPAKRAMLPLGLGEAILTVIQKEMKFPECSESVK